MGNCQGLFNLKSFSITACQGVTDLGIEAVGKGCPNLKQICLRKCALLSDNGLVSLTQIESLQLEECHRITQSGFFGILVNCAENLKAISLTNCLGIKDNSVKIPSNPICKSLQSLSIRNCPGFGNNSLILLGNLCPELRTMALTGLNGISDEGLTPLVVNNRSGLSKVNLSCCTCLTDGIVFEIARCHPLTLEELNLDGCKNITDSSLFAISEHCVFIRELDVSTCKISDKGVATLACVERINLQILSISGSSVTDQILPYLCNMGGKLLGLNLQNCRSISSSSIEFLLEKLWRCDILY
jgi:EIN3-binding F-box protein